MKISFKACIIFILFAFNFNDGFAQKTNGLKPFVCGTVGKVNTAEHYTKSAPLSPTSCYYVKVYFHFIRYTDGSGGLPTSDVGTIMTNLNNAFGGKSIEIVNGGYDEINNEYYANFDASKFNQLIDVNNRVDALNIYLLANSPSLYGGKGDGILGNSAVIAFDLALTNV